MRALDAVIECHLISGSFDYLVKARLAGMSEYRSLLGSILQQMPVPAQGIQLPVGTVARMASGVAIMAGADLLVGLACLAYYANQGGAK